MFRKLLGFFGNKEIVVEIVSTGSVAHITVGGQKYAVTDDDIPGIITCGPGKITTITSENLQKMNSHGFEKGGMNFVQINQRLFINNIDINALIEKLALHKAE